MKVIKMVLEGVVIRKQSLGEGSLLHFTNVAKRSVRPQFAEGSIERVERVSNPLIIKWIRIFGKIIKEKIIQDANNIPSNIKKEDIKILEGDEIVTYFKKNLKMENKTSGYGFLLTEEAIKLLIFN